MKLKVIMSVAVVMLASLVTLNSAKALSADETEIAKVPFDFYAAGQRMPAGKYTILIDLENERITLSNDSGGPTIFVSDVYGADGSDESQLVFLHSDGVYALQQVKSDVVDMTFRTRMPEATRQSQAAPSEVEVAMNRS